MNSSLDDLLSTLKNKFQLGGASLKGNKYESKHSKIMDST